VTQLDAFWAAVAAAPDDPGPKQMLADWLAEKTDDQLAQDIAYALRWAVTRGQRPHVTPRGRFYSWSTLRRGQHKPVSPDQLPRDVFLNLGPGQQGSNFRCRSMMLAYQRLAAALRRLRDEVEIPT
jgi:uncharacterized protein (TIGR02996 family)